MIAERNQVKKAGDKNYRHFIAGMFLGFGSFFFGFFITGIFQSQSLTKPILADFKTLPSAYIVQSGSMEPAIKTGSIVFSLPSSVYKKGDIITFSTDNKKKNLVTHRIYSITTLENGETAYITKGDANKTVDSYNIVNSNIIGRTFFTIPYLGYLANYVKTPAGFILFIIVPATIIVYEELKKLIADILRFLKKRVLSSKSNHLTEAFSNVDKKFGLPRILTVIPVFTAALVFITFSGSFFTDTDTSSGNVISAASSWGPTPTPIHIVINEVFPNGGSKDEWVELFNPSDIPINISGWKISDQTAHEHGKDDTFPILDNIPAKGYAIVVTNQSEVDLSSIDTNKVRIVTLTSANIGSGLNDDGDSVYLKTDSNQEVDSMKYHNSTDPPDAPNDGTTLARVPNGDDTDSATDWQTDRIPTMGGTNGDI